MNPYEEPPSARFRRSRTEAATTKMVLTRIMEDKIWFLQSHTAKKVLFLQQLVSTIVVICAKFSTEYPRRSLKESTSIELARTFSPPAPQSSIHSSGDFWPQAQDSPNTRYMEDHRESLQSLHAQEANGSWAPCAKYRPES